MRVIAGKAKGHKLRLVPGTVTRPITDRVKENLFNIIGDWVIDTRWLDLFAGTGQVGIEALSRGAEHVVFVDNSRAAVKTVNQNLRSTKLANQARVQLGDAYQYLGKGVDRPFDVIYIAPPQYREMWSKVLLALDRYPRKYLEPRGMAIVQIDPKEFEELELTSFRLFDQREYGRTMLCFYEPFPSTNNSMTH